MRYFIGIPFDPETTTFLHNQQNKLIPLTKHAKWVNPHLFHLTLVFLGQLSREEIMRVDNTLIKLSKTLKSFQLQFTKIDSFVNHQKHITWIGLDDSSNLNKTARMIREHLVEQSITFDSKPFMPHITLSRETVFFDDIDLTQFIIDHQVDVTRFHLYLSQQENNHLTYTPIYTYLLK